MAVQQNETNVITKLERIIYSSMKFYEFQRSNNYGHFSGDLLYVDNVMVLDKLFLSFDPLMHSIIDTGLHATYKVSSSIQMSNADKQLLLASRCRSFYDTSFMRILYILNGNHTNQVNILILKQFELEKSIF